MPITLDGTTGIKNVLGSASAPAESNTTSSNTGLYFPTSTTLGLSTNGTAALTIDASQNVGIGTTSPATTLNVVAANTAGTDNIGNVFIRTIDSYAAADVGGKLTLGGYYNATSTYAFGGIAGRKENATLNNVAGYLQFLTTTSGGALTERMRIDSSGNVGIGLTANAGTKLQVAAATNITLGIANATTIAGAITLEAINNARTVNIPMELRATNFSFTGPSSTTVIDSSGNVGIGTSSPQAKEHIAVTTSAITETLRLDNVGNFSDNGNKITWYNAAQAFEAASIAGRREGSGTGYAITFGTSSNFTTTNATERMRIDSSGYVGIGTSSPAYKLDVNGATSASYLNLNENTAAAPGVDAAVTRPANGTLAFITNTAERARIDTSGYMQGTVNGLSAGRIPAMQFFRLNANLAGANATGAQSIFGVGVTLVGSTQYAFESVVLLSKSAGTTSHTIGMGFGGTATINNVLYYLSSQDQTAAGVVGTAGSATTGVFLSTINTATNTTFTQAITTAARTVSYTVKGTVSINAGGTFIPQYTLSAAPGGAYSTVAGSYFAIYPLAASGSNVNIGSWA